MLYFSVPSVAQSDMQCLYALDTLDSQSLGIRTIELTHAVSNLSNNCSCIIICFTQSVNARPTCSTELHCFLEHIIKRFGCKRSEVTAAITAKCSSEAKLLRKSAANKGDDIF
jgi:hypothetical protein